MHFKSCGVAILIANFNLDMTAFAVFFMGKIMTTDVDVQFFSQENGLTLDNNWGDLIRLLDTCLANGLLLTNIVAASISNQGDIHLTTYAQHKCLLFQIIELSNFAPFNLNGKYRIKGVPSATELILKAEHTGGSITTTGDAKLAALGYDIVFRDSNDVKRVYRAKNPTAQHPFIRVDESLLSSDGVSGVYTDTYAKYAMVGLLEHMEHIDDFENPGVLQLPFIPSNPKYNWRVEGVGSAVVRGYSKWYWARSMDMTSTAIGGDSVTPSAGGRVFTIVGDANAFYFIRSLREGSWLKTVSGCGLYESALPADVVPSWFLSTCLDASSVTHNGSFALRFGAMPASDGGEITSVTGPGAILVPKYTPAVKLNNTASAYGIAPNYRSGGTSSLYNGSIGVPALSIPIYIPADKILLGTLKHICYSGEDLSQLYLSLPKLSGNSMYVSAPSLIGTGRGGFNYYLGELE